jgi:Tfp pilus assembly protein PilP
MKLTTGILLLGMAAGTAWGQNPNVIESTRNSLKAAEQKKAADSNPALAAPQGQTAKPAAPAMAMDAKPASHKPSTASAASQAKGTTTGTASKPKAGVASKVVKVTTAPKVAAKPKAAKAAASKPAQAQQTVAVEDKKNPVDGKKETPKAISLTGRRDPFISPVVNHSMVGSGCSTGKRCLAIDQISLKGVVRAEAGMIAVVVNALDKAYFLRENDPVFNGYVVKITGDSIIFKETIQDKLGKPFTREVTKRISTPAV